MTHPPYLKKGDKIAITCPAKALKSPMTDAILLLESWGLKVVLGETVGAVHHQFSGTDEMRERDMQKFINDNTIKAIIAARGGYGCIRIVDDIDWMPLIRNPKWVIGFSDITVFHLQLQSMGLQSLHAQMPSTIAESSKEGLESLRKTLFGESIQYTFAADTGNRKGVCQGELIGGNLTLLVACINSVNDIDYSNKILFIEDVGEYAYAVDRMIRTLDRAGKLKNLKGLIVGGFTNIKQDDPPFGYSAYEIINSVVAKYNFPVGFNFPAGHLPDNRALILGREVKLEVGIESSNLKFL
ncbi:S66 peptidase family protein [Pedobacter arcticus]|uniref:S66 peptidase family protein n=1 Tax=Pedobacter arcticus TaxID=752140 RepID=UPI0002D81916|nr:LD-carboxypeptidase [Pedobacter arcticus]